MVRKIRPIVFALAMLSLASIATPASAQSGQAQVLATVQRLFVSTTSQASLAKTADGWRIAGASFTIEKKGCPTGP